MLKFAANVGLLWPDRPLPQRIQAAARAGFRAVEFQFPYEIPAAELTAIAHESGVSILGINAPPGDLSRGDLGLAAVSGRELEFRCSLERAFDYAVLCGATHIHVMAGNVQPDAGARGTLMDNLRWADKRAAHRRVTLLLEPLNRFDWQQYFYKNVLEVAEIIDELDATAVRLQFDCYHVGREAEAKGVGVDTTDRATGAVLGLLERLRAQIGHIQIAAVPSREEPDVGTVDYRQIFAALDDLQYDGWIGCEYHPRADTDAGLCWLQHLGRSLA